MATCELINANKLPYEESETQASTSEIVYSERVAELNGSIEKVELEREQLREALRTQLRAYEQFESIVSSKIDAKEKELRYFLVSRPVICESDCDKQNSTSAAPINSTVQAIRPVPTLIGGATKSTDGLLGPAYPTTSSSSDAAISNQLGPHRTSTDSNKNDTRSVDALACAKIPIDPSVYVVFSRLRRMQKQCNALIASNQTDLQSFTFTQNR